MSTYDQWKTREDPETSPDDECRYCEETRRENAQVVEINEALHDALADLVSEIKALGPWTGRLDHAMHNAETLLGGRS